MKHDRVMKHDNVALQRGEKDETDDIDQRSLQGPPMCPYSIQSTYYNFSKVYICHDH